MNKDNAKDYLPLVQALAEGKTIQFRANEKYIWNDSTTPNFLEPASCYRIKPEPIELEIWYHEKTGDTCCARRNDKDADWERDGFRKIKMREVL